MTHAHGQGNCHVSLDDFQMPSSSRNPRLAASVDVVEARRFCGRAHGDSQVNAPKLADRAVELPTRGSLSLMAWLGL